MPYALVDIWVQAPGYELLLAEDAQVFPGVQSVLSAMLVPLPERASPGTRGEDVIITPQPL